MNKVTTDDLMRIVLGILPNATLDMDEDGQISIHTNLTSRQGDTDDHRVLIDMDSGELFVHLGPSHFNCCHAPVDMGHMDGCPNGDNDVHICAAGIKVSEPPTQEEFQKYGEVFFHADGTCLDCGYDMVKADDACDSGEVTLNKVWRVNFVEVVIGSHVVATQDYVPRNTTGEPNSTVIYCAYRCLKCGYSGGSQFMGPRTLDDIARKQVEFMRLDYKGGA